jgi:hypothetical protein
MLEKGVHVASRTMAWNIGSKNRRYVYEHFCLPPTPVAMEGIYAVIRHKCGTT